MCLRCAHLVFQIDCEFPASGQCFPNLEIVFDLDHMLIESVAFNLDDVAAIDAEFDGECLSIGSQI